MTKKNELSREVEPTIGVIGAGAIGGFYGAMLAGSGFEVHFLLRSDYEHVAKHGLTVRSKVKGDRHLPNVHAHRSASTMPKCDWLLIGTKATGNACLMPTIIHAASTGAKIIVLQNGLGIEDELRPLMPDHLHLIGGLCYVCLQRTTPGVIEHIGAGLVRLGYHSGPAENLEERQAMTRSAAALFEAATIPVEAAPNLTAARWDKLVWNIPFGCLSVLLDAGTATLIKNPESRRLVIDLMHEVIQGARDCGYDLAHDYPDKLIAMTAALPDYLPSMYLDNAQHRRMELDAIFAAPLEAVRAAGGAMPRIEAFYRALRFKDARNVAGRA
jgi:2-dehydropantoate 2-reductase